MCGAIRVNESYLELSMNKRRLSFQVVRLNVWLAIATSFEEHCSGNARREANSAVFYSDQRVQGMVM